NTSFNRDKRFNLPALHIEVVFRKELLKKITLARFSASSIQKITHSRLYKMKKYLLRRAFSIAAVAAVGNTAFAQNGGTLSGDLMLNANFFQRDTAINASDNE